VKSFVGNDLIDLDAAHNRGRSQQPRFLQKIFSVAECAQLADQNAGDFGFALLWSAKEAAYKAAKKAQPHLVFAPRRWSVSIESLLPGLADRHGRVQIDEQTQVAVQWQSAAHWLHCMALLGPPSARIEHAVAALLATPPTASFSARERAGFSRPESAAVRSLAKQLLQRCGIDEVEILRDSEAGLRLPPRAAVNGVALAGVDLSLSHDGAYVAAVIAIAARDQP